jgi:hypothetical protein
MNDDPPCDGFAENIPREKTVEAGAKSPKLNRETITTSKQPGISLP